MKPELWDHPNLPFTVDVAGRFEPSQVRVGFDPSPRPTTPELEALIATEWERRLAIAEAEGQMLFNGPLMRYLGHRITEGDGGSAAPEFHLTVGPTCYRDFVGTNLFNHHRIGEFGRRRFADPIGTTATLISKDGRICYGRRSARVAYHALYVHTFGGALEERDRRPDGRIDPFASLCRELSEELDLAAEDLHDLACVGLIRDREIYQPELLFEARLDLTADELEARWRGAESRDEHDAIVTLPDHPDAIIPFIKSCGPIAPVAVGALFLHGDSRWGPNWSDEAVCTI